MVKFRSFPHIGLLATCTFLTVPFAEAQIALSKADIFSYHKHLPLFNSGKEGLKREMKLSASNSVRALSFRPAYGYLSAKDVPSADEIFRQGVCSADVIVVAQVQSAEAQLSADESQVLTEYEIAPVEIVKNSRLKEQDLKSILYLVQPGGVLPVDGGTISDTGERYPPPLARGKTYLLFLSALSDNRSFVIVNALSTYLFERGDVRLLSADPSGEAVKRPLLSVSRDEIAPYLRTLLSACPVSLPY